MTIKKSKGGYVIVSKKGKKLSKKLSSKKAAQKRLGQIEFFKRKKK